MRQQAITVFDEFVPQNTTATTSAQFNSALGASDQLAFHVIVDNSAGAGTIDIYVDTSCDGRNWIQRNDQRTTGVPPTNGDIHITTTAGAIQLMWADPVTLGTLPPTVQTGAAQINMTGLPLLAFVRLRIVAANVAGSAAHVKIYATLRGPR